MVTIVEIIFCFFLVLLSVSVIIFFIQIACSFLPYSKNQYQNISDTISTVILIPAHNESIGISSTLHSIKNKIEQSSNIKVLVVADNCDDDTVQVVRSHNIEVIERFDKKKRGKGYALDFGIQYLSNTKPDIVLILDADCLVGDHAISTLVNHAIFYKRPIQGLYLMHSHHDAPIKAKIAEFAWRVKNQVRPMGFHKLGLPCQLMGSGMAFPWQAISQVSLATGHIVEDMKLGVDLARLKLPPRFCPEALITSQFPMNKDGISSQRTRWEHGHIGMIVKEGPSLICKSIINADLKMLALALEMCVPPLALLVLMISLLSGLGIILSVLTKQLLPWSIAFLDLLFVGLGVALAWFKYGKNIVSFSELLLVPLYILFKIPLYVKFIFKRQSDWVRSKRDS